MKHFAVILAGCGVYDGAEIQEAVLTLLAIEKTGSSYEIFAPDVMQHHVVNHMDGSEQNEKRNVLIEAARIARGSIKPLSAFKADDFDGLVFPGGFGVAKNLCSYAFEGAKCKVNNEVVKAIREMHHQNKPIGAMCIAPVVLAKVLGNVELTIGQDQATADDINAMGASHRMTKHREIIIDKSKKVITTPCYMLDSSVLDIAIGTENLIKAMISLM